jgi:hypothetical protein
MPPGIANRVVKAPMITGIIPIDSESALDTAFHAKLQIKTHTARKAVPEINPQYGLHPHWGQCSLLPTLDAPCPIVYNYFGTPQIKSSDRTSGRIALPGRCLVNY